MPSSAVEIEEIEINMDDRLNEIKIREQERKKKEEENKGKVSGKEK